MELVLGDDGTSDDVRKLVTGGRVHTVGKVCATPRGGDQSDSQQKWRERESAAETGPSITKHCAHMLRTNFGRKKLEVPPTLTGDRKVLVSRKAGLSTGVGRCLAPGGCR